MDMRHLSQIVHWLRILESDSGLPIRKYEMRYFRTIPGDETFKRPAGIVHDFRVCTVCM